MTGNCPHCKNERQLLVRLIDGEVVEGCLACLGKLANGTTPEAKPDPKPEPAPRSPRQSHQAMKCTDEQVREVWKSARTWEEAGHRTGLSSAAFRKRCRALDLKLELPQASMQSKKIRAGHRRAATARAVAQRAELAAEQQEPETELRVLRPPPVGFHKDYVNFIDIHQPDGSVERFYPLRLIVGMETAA